MGRRPPRYERAEIEAAGHKPGVFFVGCAASASRLPALGAQAAIPIPGAARWVPTRQQDGGLWRFWQPCRIRQNRRKSRGLVRAAVQWPQKTVSDWIADFADFGNLAESGKTAANHADSFEPPSNGRKKLSPTGSLKGQRCQKDFFR
jgi:hypothetical protein